MIKEKYLKKYDITKRLYSPQKMNNQYILSVKGKSRVARGLLRAIQKETGAQTRMNGSKSVIISGEVDPNKIRGVIQGDSRWSHLRYTLTAQDAVNGKSYMQDPLRGAIEEIVKMYAVPIDLNDAEKAKRWLSEIIERTNNARSLETRVQEIEKRNAGLAQALAAKKDITAYGTEELLIAAFTRQYSAGFAKVVEVFNDAFPDGISQNREITLVDEKTYVISRVGKGNLRRVGIETEKIPDLDRLTDLLKEKQWECEKQMRLAEAYITINGTIRKNGEDELYDEQTALMDELRPRREELKEKQEEINVLRAQYAAAQQAQEQKTQYDGPEVAAYVYAVRESENARVSFLIPAAPENIRTPAARWTVLGLGEALEGKGIDVRAQQLEHALRVDLLYSKDGLPNKERVKAIVADINIRMNTETLFARLGMQIDMTYYGEIHNHDH